MLLQFSGRSAEDDVTSAPPSVVLAGRVLRPNDGRHPQTGAGDTARPTGEDERQSRRRINHRSGQSRVHKSIFEAYGMFCSVNTMLIFNTRLSHRGVDLKRP